MPFGLLVQNEICSVTTFLDAFKEGACLTDGGKVFHSFGDENVNEPVYRYVLGPVSSKHLGHVFVLKCPRTFLGQISCFIKLSSAEKFLLFVLNLGRKFWRPTTVFLS